MSHSSLQAKHLALLGDVDDSGPHFARRYFGLEHVINLIEPPSLEFRHKEESPHGRNKRQSTKDEANLTLEITLIGVDHVRNHTIEQRTSSSLRGSSDGNSGRTENSAAHFTKDSESHGAEGGEVDEGVDNCEGGLNPLCSACLYDIEDADEHEDGGERVHPGKEN